MVFVKFTSLANREAGIRAFKSLKAGLNTDRSFMNVDLPIVKRVPKQFLCGMKRFLHDDWEYNKECLYVDTSVAILAQAILAQAILALA